MKQGIISTIKAFSYAPFISFNQVNCEILSWEAEFFTSSLFVKEVKRVVGLF